MDKSIIFIFITISFFFQAGCSDHGHKEKEPASVKFIFIINNPLVEKKKTIKLKRRFAYQSMSVIENSLNDTGLIGIMKVAPLKKGKLYKSEFFMDSIWYSYKPYKATKGRLVIEHVFSDY